MIDLKSLMDTGGQPGWVRYITRCMVRGEMDMDLYLDLMRVYRDHKRRSSNERDGE